MSQNKRHNVFSGKKGNNHDEKGIKREHFLKKGSKICCCFCHILKLYQGGTRSQSEAPKHEKSQQ